MSLLNTFSVDWSHYEFCCRFSLRLTLAALGIKLNDYWREKKEKKAKERAFRALERKSLEGNTEENDESEEEEEEEEEAVAEEEENEEEEIV